MNGKVMLTLEDMRVLANTAERNGTQHNFPAVMFQWAEAAKAEIEHQSNNAAILAQQVADLTAELEAAYHLLGYRDATIERVTSERDALVKTLAASCVDEREQLWEACPGGGCSRAIAAETERDALRADAERWQRVDSHGHGRYWLENRGAILDCLTRHGYELLSSSSGWTLHKLPAAIAGKAHSEP